MDVHSWQSDWGEGEIAAYGSSCTARIAAGRQASGAQTLTRNIAVLCLSILAAQRDAGDTSQEARRLCADGGSQFVHLCSSGQSSSPAGTLDRGEKAVQM